MMSAMDTKWIVRVGLAAAANGLLLLLAAVLFDQFGLNFGGWLLGTIIFTAFTVGLRGMATKYANQYASQATWVGGLILTLLGLLVIDILLRGVYIEGGLTWILSTLIIWAGTLVYDRYDDYLAKQVEGRLGR